MAQTTNKYQIIQKVSATDTLLLHPETEAEAVLYKNTASQLSASNIQSAVDEVAAKVKTINEGGVVTGIKGNAESVYRKGQVNLTPANIGAESAGAVSSHNTNTSSHSDMRTAITTAQSKADSAYALAEGRIKAVSFDTVSAMTTALKNAANTEYKVGDNIYIKSEESPDYWISGILENNTGAYGYFEISELETAKVDLTDYQKKTDSALATNSKSITGAINEIKETSGSAANTAQANADLISEIVNGTTKVAEADHAINADNANHADNAQTADTAANAQNADNATYAQNADNANYANVAAIAEKLGESITLSVNIKSGKKSNGSTDIIATGSESFDGSGNADIQVELGDSGVTAGTYSAVQVNSKGIAVAGGQMLEIGISGQTMPGASLATGGLFFKLI
jgi:hypothetical protein